MMLWDMDFNVHVCWQAERVLKKPLYNEVYDLRDRTCSEIAAGAVQDDCVIGIFVVRLSSLVRNSAQCDSRHSRRV